jgi:hypothetical protein
MVHKITYIEIEKYSKVTITKEEFNDCNNYKKIFGDKLKLCNWNNAGS